jgi:hypothetical protein
MKEFFAKHIAEENPAELFHWYPTQTSPQQVMISVDIREGDVSARYNPEIGNAISSAEYDGIWLMFELFSCPTSESANEIIDNVVCVLNTLLKDNDWSVGEFFPYGEPALALITKVKQITQHVEYNSISHVNCDRDEPLSIFDEYGNFVDTVYDE